MSTRIDSFRRAVALEEVEQVPVMPSVSVWVAKFCGIPLKTLIYDVAAMAKAQIDAQRAVGYDVLFPYVDPLYIPEAFGCGINFHPSGPMAQPLNLETEADIDTLRSPDVLKDGRLPLILELVEKLVKTPGREVPVIAFTEGPFTTCARIYGVEKLMIAVLENRPLVEKLLEKVGEVIGRFGQAVAERGADGLLIPDPVSSSTMISPKLYRSLVLPNLQRCLSSFRLPVILHVCGNTKPILDMMAETGAQMLSLDQCMDLGLAKRQLLGRCGVAGNVDPMTVLRGTVEDVKRASTRCLEQGGKCGYILMAGCAVPGATPIKNLQAMVESARPA